MRALGSAAALALLAPGLAQAQSSEGAHAEQTVEGQKEERREAREEAVEQAKEGIGGEEEYKNGVVFGFSHTFSLLRSREGPLGDALPEGEHLYGLIIGYERVLHPNVALSILKPFYFNHERIDSDLEILVVGMYRKNSWEPFLGAGIISSLRSFETLRSSAEDRDLEFAFGVHFVIGFKYFFTPRWAIEIEFGYSVLPTSDIFEHEIADSYQGVHFF